MLDDNEIKQNFFMAIKNANVSEIVKYFRNHDIKPWLFKEEEEYTGNYYFYKKK
jgi:hypothetical protein